LATLAILEDPTRIKAVIQAGRVSVDRRLLD
jgi:hypothetical protein